MPAGPLPSLADFVLAASARALYRDYVRVVRTAPPHAKRDLRDAVRAGFAASRAARGDAARHAQADGRLQLKRLKEAVDMSA